MRNTIWFTDNFYNYHQANKLCIKLYAIAFFGFIFLYPIMFTSAENIVLKYGEKINGKVIAKNDKYVVIDVRGASIIYHTFEIESIDGKNIEAIKNTYFEEELLKSIAPSKEPVKLDVVTAEEYLTRGIAYYGKGEFNHAIANLNYAIKINPNYVEVYLYRGLAYVGEENPTQAIADYSKAIELNPKHEEAYFVRGIAYAGKGNLAQAIADYSKAIELNPKYVQAYLNRGFISIAKGDTDQAIADANKVIEINSNIPIAYYIRGLAYVNRNNMEQAILNYSKAIKINPNYAEAYVNRGIAYAYNIIEKEKIDPNSPSAYLNIGIAYLDKAGFDKAISDCNKAIEINPKYTDAYFIRARIYFLANNFGKAWEDIHKVEDLGGTIKPEFLEELKRTSGREK